MKEERQPETTSVTEFLNTRYRDYALYVLHSRAIPSLVDGLKPGQRKVVWTADKTARSSKVKVAALSGMTVAKANFHHGDGSLSGATILMAGAWCNNVPLFEGEGNFGSRLVTEAGAPRYVFVRMGKAFDRYFGDNEILESSGDPEDPEPRYYLPFIPWVLVNGASGIAIGFATEIQPRDPKVLARICRDYISGKVTRAKTLSLDIPPYFAGFRGTVVKREDGGWACRGNYNRKSASQIEITEIPVGVDRAKYVTFLDKLEEDGKITSYEDRCTKGEFRFVLRFPKATNLDELDVVRFLRLERGLGENITTIDENGRLKLFDSAAELLVHFCDYRLGRYAKRFEHWILRDSEKMRRMQLKRHFILKVSEGHLVFTDKTKSQLRYDIKDKMADFPSVITEDDVSRLLEVRTYEFCQDEVDHLDKHIFSLSQDLLVWQSAKAEEWYADELETLMK